MKKLILILSLILNGWQALALEDEAMVQLSGGLMFTGYDREIDDSKWDYQVADSTVTAIDLHHSMIFHQNKWQLFYGFGLDHIKSVSTLGNSRIETTGYGLTFRGGMLYHPPNTKIAFGHSIGILAMDDYTTRLYTQGFQTKISHDEFVLFDRLINSFWFKWKFSEMFRAFTRIDVRRIDRAAVSQNVGVEVVF